jgi:hypothetical protein
MVSAHAGSQGGGYFVVSPDAQSISREFAPYDSLSTRNKKTLNPHGIDVDEDHDRIITSDFIDVASTSCPSAVLLLQV